MACELLSRKGRDFISITDYPDEASALAKMQLEGEGGEADNWDLTPEGERFYWECKFDRETQEVWTKKLPPDQRAF